MQQGNHLETALCQVFGPKRCKLLFISLNHICHTGGFSQTVLFLHPMQRNSTKQTKLKTILKKYEQK